MNGRRRSGGWLAGALSALVLAAWPGPAGGAERLQAGAMDLTLSGGYSIDLRTHREAPAADGFHLMPHFGYVATDEHGPGWAAGNLELLAEPVLIHLDAPESATVGGLAALARWLFVGTGTVRPYVEAGGGVVLGRVNIRQTNCDVNFMLEGGPGLLVFVSRTTALSAGYRFQHFSNADRCSKNLGLNSSLFHVGISYFFH